VARRGSFFLPEAFSCVLPKLGFLVEIEIATDWFDGIPYDSRRGGLYIYGWVEEDVLHSYVPCP
jgi:hypothetical protein